jgi:ABC-2 type transport system permease protein
MTTQAHPEVSRDLILAARQGLLPARGRSWLAGFGNMLNKELGEWFHTRFWLWQLIIWILIINGFVAFFLFIVPILETFMPGINAAMEQSYGSLPPGGIGITNYFSISVLAGTIGMIILAQDEIIQEQQSGTAAWTLSKPASRQAFVLTKLLSNSIGALIFIVAIPALVLAGEIYLYLGQMVALLPFLTGVGVLMLDLFYYLSLVILLGVLFESRVKVMGITFGLVFGGMMIANFLPQICYILPVTMDKVASLIVLGMPLPDVFISQIISAAVSSLLFVLVALWRFQRKEF